MTLTVIGTGFVGVVTAGVFASFGNKVYGLDIDQNKIDSLQHGKIPFFEPGLEELVAEQLKTGRLHFTTSYEEAVSNSDVIMIAVGTPSAPDGQADLRFVVAAAESAAPFLKEQAIVIVKSTVQPGTNQKVEMKIKGLTSTKFYTASVPEFLKEGSAVQDTLHPDRIVIGANDEYVFEKLSELHQPLQAPILKMSPESAQMAKYTANAYLATRITFINQIADLCEKNGADITEVIRAIGEDKRIGKHYWYPGFGYGGSCFPKDVKELAAYSRAVDEPHNLMNRISELNEQRIYRLLDKYEKTVSSWDGKKVAVLGVAFKPNTDDTREAPSTKVIPYLLAKGAIVKAFDPMAHFQMSVDNEQAIKENFTQLPDIEAVVQDADIIMALIEWPEIVEFDFSKTKAEKRQVFIDARNQFDPRKMIEQGYQYIGVGR